MLPKESKQPAQKKDGNEFKNAWGVSETKKTYGLMDFLIFAFPAMWSGGWQPKFQVILTFFLLLLAKCFQVAHPLILKMAIDSVLKNEDAFMILIYFGIVR